MVLFVIKDEVVGVVDDLLALAALGADAELLGAVLTDGMVGRLDLLLAALVALAGLGQRLVLSVTVNKARIVKTENSLISICKSGERTRT